jgi:NAD(P)-dependent dehydrogenase (short-subunit alcohol dehydrogenase family)
MIVMADSKCAVVVGAGTGTGAEVAKMLAREGHSVVLARRNAGALAPLVEEIETSGGFAVAVVADASDEAQVASVFEQAESSFGPPRFVLFNAAGFTMGPITETTSEQFEDMWRAASYGGFVVGREAARRMVPHGEGTILFTGATAAVKASASFAAFAAGKHGLRAVAQSMAKELGPQGVHVAHLIIDGVIDVPRVRETMPDLAASKGEDGLIDPTSIAATMLWLHKQPKNAWTFELDLRPFKETW